MSTDEGIILPSNALEKLLEKNYIARELENQKEREKQEKIARENKERRIIHIRQAYCVSFRILTKEVLQSLDGDQIARLSDEEFAVLEELVDEFAGKRRRLAYFVGVPLLLCVPLLGWFALIEMFSRNPTDIDGKSPNTDFPSFKYLYMKKHLQSIYGIKKDVNTIMRRELRSYFEDS